MMDKANTSDLLIDELAAAARISTYAASLYVVQLAETAPDTMLALVRRTAALAHEYEVAGEPNPVGEAHRRVGREMGETLARQAVAAMN